MPGPLVNVKRLFRGADTWREVFVLNIRSHKKQANVSSPAARAELKSVTSSSETCLADCRVLKVGVAGLNGKELNACASLKQIRPSLYYIIGLYRHK